MATTLLLGIGGSLLHPARVTYWEQSPGEYDFVIKDHLGVDHERICAVVSKDGDAKDSDLWDTVTLKSAGARVGISRNKLPLDAAKLAAEQDCR